MYVAFLTELNDKKYKYYVKVFQTEDGELTLLANIKFGAAGYGDYTLGTTDEQKKNYIARHKSKEDWTKTGYLTAGFWARWVLWNKRTVKESIDDINDRFDNLKVYY